MLKETGVYILCTVGYVMLLPFLIVASPVMPIIYALGVEQNEQVQKELKNRIIELEKEINKLNNIEMNENDVFNKLLD